MPPFKKRNKESMTICQARSWHFADSQMLRSVTNDSPGEQKKFDKMKKDTVELSLNTAFAHSEPLTRAEAESLFMGTYHAYPHL